MYFSYTGGCTAVTNDMHSTQRWDAENGITMRGVVVSALVGDRALKGLDKRELSRLFKGLLSEMQKENGTGSFKVNIDLCQGKIPAYEVPTSHQLLSVRKVQFQTILCGYFRSLSLRGCQAGLARVCQVNMWPLFFQKVYFINQQESSKSTESNNN